MIHTVGITGGIGSGKSVISAILRILGYAVYDADTEAKILMNRSPKIRAELSALFGTELYPDNTLNRQLLASLIFTDVNALTKVNAIVHPEVKRHFKAWVETQDKDKPVFMESAILFESAFCHTVDYTWAVTAPESERTMRVMQRDLCTAEQVEARMAAQMPDLHKCQLAHYTIYNTTNQAILPQIIAGLALIDRLNRDEEKREEEKKITN